MNIVHVIIGHRLALSGDRGPCSTVGHSLLDEAYKADKVFMYIIESFEICALQLYITVNMAMCKQKTTTICNLLCVGH